MSVYVRALRYFWLPIFCFFIPSFSLAQGKAQKPLQIKGWIPWFAKDQQKEAMAASAWKGKYLLLLTKVTSSKGSHYQLWWKSLEKEKKKHPPKLVLESQSPLSLAPEAFCESGEYFAILQGKDLLIFQTASWKKPFLSLPKPISYAWLKNDLLLARSYGVERYQIKLDKKKGEPFEPSLKEVSRICISPNGQKIAFWDKNTKKVYLKNLSQPLRIQELFAAPDLDQLTFTSDGQALLYTLATKRQGKRLFLYEFATKKIKARIKDPILNFVYSPAGALFFAKRIEGEKLFQPEVWCFQLFSGKVYPILRYYRPLGSVGEKYLLISGKNKTFLVSLKPGPDAQLLSSFQLWQKNKKALRTSYLHLQRILQAVFIARLWHGKLPHRKIWQRLLSVSTSLPFQDGFQKPFQIRYDKKKNLLRITTSPANGYAFQAEVGKSGSAKVIFTLHKAKLASVQLPVDEKIQKAVLLLKEALNDLNQKKYDSAKKKTLHSQKLYPHNPGSRRILDLLPHIQAAYQALAQSQLGKAKKEASAALKIFPQSRSAKSILQRIEDIQNARKLTQNAIALIEKQHYTKALAMLKEALTLDPSYQKAKEQKEKAQSLLSQLRKWEKDAKDLFHQKKYQGCLKIAQRILALQKDHPLAQDLRKKSLAALYQQAVELFQSKLWPECLKALEGILKWEKGYRPALSLKKKVEEAQRKSEEYLSKAKKFYTKDKELAKVFLGKLLQISPHHKPAKELLSKINKEISKDYFASAQALIKKKKANTFDKALKLAQKALEFDPKNTKIQQWISRIKEKVAKKKAAKLVFQANVLWQEAKKKPKQSLSLYIAALKHLEKAIQHNPKSKPALEMKKNLEEFLYSKVRNHLQKKDYVFVQKLLDMLPKSDFKQKIQNILKKEQRKNQFAKLFQNAQKLYQQNQLQKARKTLAQALKIFPKNAKALKLQSKLEKKIAQKELEQVLKKAQNAFEKKRYKEAKEILLTLKKKLSLPERGKKLLKKIEQAQQFALSLQKVNQLLQQRKWQLAKEKLHQMLAEYPASKKLQKLLKKVQSQLTLEKRKQEANELFQLAKAAYQRSDYYSALSLCLDALYLLPNEEKILQLRKKAQSKVRSLQLKAKFFHYRLYALGYLNYLKSSLQKENAEEYAKLALKLYNRILEHQKSKEIEVEKKKVQTTLQGFQLYWEQFEKVAQWVKKGQFAKAQDALAAAKKTAKRFGFSPSLWKKWQKKIHRIQKKAKLQKEVDELLQKAQKHLKKNQIQQAFLLAKKAYFKDKIRAQPLYQKLRFQAPYQNYLTKAEKALSEKKWLDAYIYLQHAKHFQSKLIPTYTFSTNTLRKNWQTALQNKQWLHAWILGQYLRNLYEEKNLKPKDFSKQMNTIITECQKLYKNWKEIQSLARPAILAFQISHNYSLSRKYWEKLLQKFPQQKEIIQKELNRLQEPYQKLEQKRLSLEQKATKGLQQWRKKEGDAQKLQERVHTAIQALYSGDLETAKDYWDVLTDLIEGQSIFKQEKELVLKLYTQKALEELQKAVSLLASNQPKIFARHIQASLKWKKLPQTLRLKRDFEYLRKLKERYAQALKTSDYLQAAKILKERIALLRKWNQPSEEEEATLQAWLKKSDETFAQRTYQKALELLSQSKLKKTINYLVEKEKELKKLQKPFPPILTALLEELQYLQKTVKKMPHNMVYVPSGAFYPGFYLGEKEEKRKQILPGFFIDKYEVSNQEYLRYLKKNKLPLEPYLLTHSKLEDPKSANLPVVGITFQEAQKYAFFVNKRLPTEAEWEKAARGPWDGRDFPWGNSFHPNYGHFQKLATAYPPKLPKIHLPTAQYKDISPYGCYNMAGNVSEWVDTDAYENRNLRLQKGGNYLFQNTPPYCSIFYQTWYPKQTRSKTVGFRCVMDLEMAQKAFGK